MQAFGIGTQLGSYGYHTLELKSMKQYHIGLVFNG